ncbi:MAG: type III-A CRISPR-associated RAMP protein Csm3 [Deltaproteobacteria bacterium]|nr:type III-A CRISPR-associated RAMP protein Csm3 [Deltaproteobacteria bacterium]
MKLIDIKQIRGTITLKSGLHIGAGDMEMKIGGTDNPVIKHPHTQQPFIPGSSLKGKVRALLEMKSGLMAKTGGNPLKPTDLKDASEKERAEGEKILRLFGSGGAEDEAREVLGPTRVSFADAFLNPEWKMLADENQWPLTEVKSENSINRIKGTAEHPRFTERVPSETVFDFSVTLKRMEGDEGLEDFLLSGLKLLQLDALGGNGSRGYGKVAFQFQDEATQRRFDEIIPL